jgi:tRNA pseudouridine32 synthase/23S rRNA pseudouridine746 synthase
MSHTETPPALRGFEYDPPQDPYLDVLHADDDILILNKPSGLLMVPGNRPGLEDCLVTRAGSTHRHASLVHRLDKDTSGVCVMGMHHKAQRHLSRQFEKRRTTKLYVARVAGEVKGTQGTIDLPLTTDPDQRPKQHVDHENGRSAITHWQVLDREEDATRLLLQPETGRSHQLRVHLLELGHAILGDNLYADDEALARAERLQLHAFALTLRHPSGGTPMTFYMPVPF